MVFSLVLHLVFYQGARLSPTCLFSSALVGVRTHLVPCLCFTDYFKFLCFWELRFLDSHGYWADVSFLPAAIFKISNGSYKLLR